MTKQIADHSTGGEKCPCCGGAARRWGKKSCYGSDWSIHRCDRCGFGFVWPRPTWQFIDDFYRQHGGHGREDAKVLDATAIRLREQADPNSSVDADRVAKTIVGLLARGANAGGRRPSLLDVGCGYGFFSRSAIANGFHVAAIELSDHEAEIAREIAAVDPIRVSFEEFEPGDSFDAIVMSQVLEHAIDADQWVGKAAHLLRPGGVLAVAVPNFDGVFRRLLGIRDFMIIPPAHLNYFGPRALECMLRKHGFSCPRTDHVTRIPGETIRRRLGGYGRIAEILGRGCGRAFGATTETLRIGGIINLYGVRLPAPSA